MPIYSPVKIPYNEPNGVPQLNAEAELVGSVRLADSTGITLKNGELGKNLSNEIVSGTTAGNKRIFDYTDFIFNLFGQNFTTIPLGAVKILTIKPSTFGANFSVTTSTGYARGMNWDGTLTANAGTGNPDNPVQNTWLTAASPYTLRVPKLLAVWATNSSGVSSGNVTGIFPEGEELITYFNVENAPQIKTFNLYNNLVSDINFDNNSLFESVVFYDSAIKRVNLGNSPDLYSLTIFNASKLKQIDLTYQTKLYNLVLAGNTPLEEIKFPASYDGDSGAYIVYRFCDSSFTGSATDPLFIQTVEQAEAIFDLLPDINGVAVGGSVYIGSIANDISLDISVAVAKGWAVSPEYV